MDAIEIKGLTKTYGKQRGIEDINLSIKKGEVFGFVGPNGAGKSTTIRCIMELIDKNKGTIFLNKETMTKNNKLLKEKIGYLPSEIHLYDDLTVEKMLAYSASFYWKDCTQKMQYLVNKLELDVKKKINEVSLGNLKKVGIVLTLMHDPEIIIMDEATSGLDPLMQEVFYELIKEEQEKGTTIFFSSHILSEIKRICDRVAIIKEGKLIKVDKVENLMDSDFFIVTVETKETRKLKEQLDTPMLEEKEDRIKFIYHKDSNSLLKLIANYTITKILIEEPSIEEIFMHYYQ